MGQNPIEGSNPSLSAICLAREALESYFEVLPERLGCGYSLWNAMI
jgi:hypothetical protein